jgi:hypothetical protein
MSDGNGGRYWSDIRPRMRQGFGAYCGEFYPPIAHFRLFEMDGLSS